VFCNRLDPPKEGVGVPRRQSVGCIGGIATPAGPTQARALPGFGGQLPETSSNRFNLQCIANNLAFDRATLQIAGIRLDIELDRRLTLPLRMGESQGMVTDPSLILRIALEPSNSISPMGLPCRATQVPVTSVAAFKTNGIAMNANIASDAANHCLKIILIARSATFTRMEFTSTVTKLHSSPIRSSHALPMRSVRRCPFLR
jgi:hypothetical protein